MKEGIYKGKPVFVDLIDLYEGIPMSDIIKLINDAKPKLNMKDKVKENLKLWDKVRPRLKDHLNDVIVTTVPPWKDERYEDNLR